MTPRHLKPDWQSVRLPDYHCATKDCKTVTCRWIWYDSKTGLTHDGEDHQKAKKLLVCHICARDAWLAETHPQKEPPHENQNRPTDHPHPLHYRV